MLLSQWQDSVCFDSEGFFRDRRRQAVVVYTQRWTGLMVDVQSCVHFTKFVPFWHSLEVRREYHAITLEQHVRLDVSQRDLEHIRHCSFWHFRCKVKAGNGCISEAKLVSVFRVFSFRAQAVGPNVETHRNLEGGHCSSCQLSNLRVFKPTKGSSNFRSPPRRMKCRHRMPHINRRSLCGICVAGRIACYNLSRDASTQPRSLKSPDVIWRKASPVCSSKFTTGDVVTLVANLDPNSRGTWSVQVCGCRLMG